MGNLVLAPRYGIWTVLQEPGGNLLALKPPAALSVALHAALRGPAGLGLLGVAVVEPGEPVDLSLPVSVYMVTLEADEPLSFINGSPAVNRKRVLLDVVQGAGGGHQLVPDAGSVTLGPDLPAIELSAEAGTCDALLFMYRHEAGKCHFMGINHGST